MRRAGGGAGFVRLRDGTALFVAFGPGDDRDKDDFNPYGSNPPSRWLAMWKIEGDLRTATMGSSAFLGAVEVEPGIGWNGYTRNSENLSILTECETGQVYVVSMGRIQETGVDDNFYALWALEPGEVYDAHNRVLPALTPIAYNRFEGRLQSCYLRGAGSVYVAADHRPWFLCHEFRNGAGNEVDFRVYRPD